MARNSGFGHSNPVFDRSPAFSRGRYATFDTGPTPTAGQLQNWYDAPTATAVQTGRMTLDDVVMKAAMSFGLLIAVAGTSYFLLPPQMAMAGTVLGLLVGLVLGLVITFRQSTSPALVLSYAVAEGLVVGGVSRIYGNAFGDGLVTQAILGTLCAVGGMLLLYSSGKLRATAKFTKVLMTAAIGYLVLALVSLVSSFFGVGGGLGLYGVTGLGLLLAAAGVAIASLFLVLDFDFIEQGIRRGAPARYSWLAAAGLMMTIVWLYLEMLRLLAILRGND